MSQIHIVKKDVTKLNVDAVVNAANEGLDPGGGVCGAIFREAGYDELNKACRQIGHCKTGSAVITPGFKLNAKYIIHAVGPIWQGGRQWEALLLHQCYRAAIYLAIENGCKSIAFPLISSGIFGYPKKEAWEVALRAVDGFADEIEVYFAVLEDEVLELGNQVYRELFDISDKRILESIDKEKLWQIIEYLCRVRKIEWKEAEVVGKTEDGKNIYTPPYPIYPDELEEVFCLLGADWRYIENMESWPENLLPTDMTAGQIKTMLTEINQSERFGDGNIAAALEDGTLLKLMLRLDDLLKLEEEAESEGSEQSD